MLKGMAAGAALGGVTAAIGGLVTGVTSFLSRVGEMDKLGAKLGVPVEKMSAFASAMEQAGVSSEELTGHFENFAERSASLVDGSKQMAETFAKIGLSAQDLAPLDEVDRLLLTMKKLQGVSQSTRLGVMSALGGDKFQDLNSVLNRQGADGIQKLAENAGANGGIITKEQAEEVRQLTGAWNELKAAGMNALRSIGAALLPLKPLVMDGIGWVKGLANGFREFIGSLEVRWLKFKLFWQQSFGDMSTIWFGFKYDFLRAWEDLTTTMALGFADAVQVIQKGFEDIGLGNKFKNNIVDSGAWISSIKEAHKAAITALDADHKNAMAGAYNAAKETQKRIAELEAAQAAARGKKIEFFAKKVENSVASIMAGGPIKGGFGGSLSSLAFGLGDGGDIAKNTAATAANTASIDRQMKANPGLVWDS